MDLYSKKHKGWFVEKSHKTKEDYEYEKNKDELTFKPKMLTQAGHSSAHKKADVTPNE